MPADKESKRVREREKERELACWIKLSGLLKRKGRAEESTGRQILSIPRRATSRYTRFAIQQRGMILEMAIEHCGRTRYEPPPPRDYLCSWCYAVALRLRVTEETIPRNVHRSRGEFCSPDTACPRAFSLACKYGRMKVPRGKGTTDARRPVSIMETIGVIRFPPLPKRFNVWHE